MNGLDLYAKIEYLFDFDEVMEFLWDKYIEQLKSLNVSTILDIGCGSGGFMLKAKNEGFDIIGIDISEEMINNAKTKNLEVYHKDLCEFNGQFDACVAIFDVINYMDKEYLSTFFNCVKNVLKPNGYFLFDINTLYGFEEVAQGTLSVNDNKNFVILNSIFENNKMTTKITTFSNENGCYTKNDGEIIQHFYKNQELKKLSPLKFSDKIDISLYDGIDKNLLIFKNE